MNPPTQSVTDTHASDHDDVALDIIARVRSVVQTSESVALHEPNLGELEQRYVNDCVASGWVSSVGRFVDQFERDLAAYTGAKYAVATVNGTSALHVGLILAGVGRDDEVICPALSFVATANAISYCGAVPHFVDAEYRTLGMDAEKLRSYLSEISRVEGDRLVNRITGRRIAAIVPMHTLGHSVDMPALLATAETYGLPIVEDAAESLGTTCGGQHTGTFGLVGALSFNGNKIMTTGGGGAILTNDHEIAVRAKHLTTTAKVPHPWQYVHDEVAFNYRMPNLNAAMGCAQLERFPDFRERKQILASDYRHHFSDCKTAQFVDQWEKESSNFWLNAIQIAKPTDDPLPLRNAILQKTNEAGLMTRPMWDLLSDLPIYSACPHADLTVSQDIAQRTICLPSSVGLVPATA
ncbi:LegC family aminotransferase [Neorhodopirellula lusitana]|uniref:LegC family aminotransferase n=1 Tax=Neorhodopirellula lusitana TaxID=445327 RepID=UPI00384B9725